jgi:hypothetical protein
VCREYIAKVCTVEDVLKGWEDFDPDRGPPCSWDESARKSAPLGRRSFLGISGCAWNWENLPARIEKYEPCSYREEREEELACDRKDEGEE